MQECEVDISKGKITVQKPLAGARNKALIKAETADGIKNTVMMVELLPYCIKSHPFGTVPVRQALDSLSIDDYDKLIDGLAKLIKPAVGDVEKKLEQPSEQKESQTDGSVKS